MPENVASHSDGPSVLLNFTMEGGHRVAGKIQEVRGVGGARLICNAINVKVWACKS